MPLLLLELNEINFDFVRPYIEQGELPMLPADREPRLSQRRPPSRYDELEPWIQWVTAHTGLS